MTKPYSNDLRQRAANTVVSGGTIRAVAERFGVSHFRESDLTPGLPVTSRSHPFDFLLNRTLCKVVDITNGGLTHELS